MLPGDRVLLCTDGLSGYLGAEEIQAVVSGAGDLELVLQTLLKRALDAGGADNVTIIVVEF